MKWQDTDEITVSKDQRKYIYTALFLLWPFGSALASLKFNREPLTKNVFWFFCIFFGYTFIIDAELSDSARYTQKFYEYSRSSFTLRDLFNDLYAANTMQLDIFQPVLTFGVSRMTTNPSFLFMAVAFVFGFFYSRNIWFILERIRGRSDIPLLVYVTVFILLNPIWFINGFRMYTAIHIFLYGALLYLFEGKKSGLLWAISSVFVHFSLFVAVILLIGYRFLPRKILIFYWFFIITSFIKEIDLLFVRDLLSLFPDFIYYRIASYTDIAYAESLAEHEGNVNRLLIYAEQVLSWVAYGMATFMIVFDKKVWRNHKKLNNLFCFGLFMYGAANILSLIPSGGRFLSIANLLIYAVFIFYLRIAGDSLIFRMVKYASLPFLCLFILVTLRIGMDFYGLFTLIGNPILAFVVDDLTPLIQYIR